MLEVTYTKRLLRFRVPAKTSRGTFTVKPCWYVKVWDSDRPGCHGIGECAPFPGLSAEDHPGHEARLADACARVNDFHPDRWRHLSATCFALETALADLRSGGRRLLFPSSFTAGEYPVQINGLVWMGDRRQMARAVEEKIAEGFRCIKLKIGGIDLRDEIALLRDIRSRFPADRLQLRLDANGAFTPGEASRVLETLARFDIHSIEQPIPPGQWEHLRALCSSSPVPVALDEELIGITSRERKIELLERVVPRYIVLKPSLAGGLASCEEWISLASERDIGWWATSALESNIGLNAIAQWYATRPTGIPQGLGTGELYTNNIPSPLVRRGPDLVLDLTGNWDTSELFPLAP